MTRNMYSFTRMWSRWRKDGKVNEIYSDVALIWLYANNIPFVYWGNPFEILSPIVKSEKSECAP